MEDLFGVIMVVIALVAAVAQKAKKQAKQQSRPRPMPSPVAYPAAEPAPAPAPVAYPMAEPASGPASAAYMAEPAAFRRPAMAPRLQVTPRTEDLFAGSMHAETHEGEDPCHEAQLQSAPPLLAPMPEEKPGLQLSFSSDSMVQAFVMQEILQRPCKRRR